LERNCKSKKVLEFDVEKYGGIILNDLIVFTNVRFPSRVGSGGKRGANQNIFNRNISFRVLFRKPSHI